MSETALKLPERLRPPCPRGCVDVEGCGCDWNVEREAWPNGSAPLFRSPGEIAAAGAAWVTETELACLVATTEAAHELCMTKFRSAEWHDALDELHRRLRVFNFGKDA